MKLVVTVLAAAVVVAAALLRPVSPPVASGPANAWTSVSPTPRAGRAGASPPPRAVVYVAGAVNRPGVYVLARDARVRDAVARAGGMRAAADPVAVNLAAHLRDGDEVIVPARGEPVAAASPRAKVRRGAIVCGTGSRGRTRGGGGSTTGCGWSHRDAAPPSAPIDLNTASAELLATVPGIGAGLAMRIVAFREANGPFTSADELLDVSGMTDRRLDAIAPYVVAR